MKIIGQGTDWIKGIEEEADDWRKNEIKRLSEGERIEGFEYRYSPVGFPWRLRW